MTAWLMGTSLEPARRLVRWVAGSVVVAAFTASLWAANIGITLLTLFWTLLLMGPALAWPLVGGRLIGLLLGISGAVIFVLILGSLGREGSTLSGLVTAFGISALLLLVSGLLAFPQAVVLWVRGYVRP